MAGQRNGSLGFRGSSDRKFSQWEIDDVCGRVEVRATVLLLFVFVAMTFI